MSRVCYFVTAEKTEFFVNFELGLETSQGLFVSPGSYWTRRLLNWGIQRDNILCLGAHFALRREKPLFDESEAQEYLFPLFERDRLLKNKSTRFKRHLISVYYTCIRSFLESNNISICLGEQTWFFEYVGKYVVEVIGGKFYVVDGVKVPDTLGHARFSFFYGDFLESMVEPFCAVNLEVKKTIDQFYMQYMNCRAGTSYLESYDRRRFGKSALKKIAHHLSRFLFDRHNMTRPSLVYLAVKKFEGLVEQVRNVSYVSGNPSTVLDRYVLICLHRQPDSQIDVVASKYSDQENTILRVISKIPEHFPVLISAHPHGGQGVNIDRLRKKFVDHKIFFTDGSVPSMKFFDNAELVFSVAGTVALEAAVQGKRAQTLVPRFFSDLMVSRRYGEALLALDDWSALLASPPPSRAIIHDYLQTVWTRSCEGSFYHPNASADYRSKENFHNIAKGLGLMMRAVSRDY